LDTLRLDLFGEAGDQVPDTAEYMGFWRRVGARAIDTAFHWLITFVVVFVVGVHLFIRQEISGTPAAPSIELMGQRTFAAIAFSLLGSVMYGAIAEGFHGSTLGKRLLGMVVLHPFRDVRMDTRWVLIRNSARNAVAQFKEMERRYQVT